MTTQLALDLSPLTVPDYEPGLSLAEKFDRFNASNPHVADALELLAGQWLRMHDRVGMKALVERLRWESGIQTTGSAYRLNNSWTAFYARLLLARHPEWSGRIVTREQRAAA